MKTAPRGLVRIGLIGCGSIAYWMHLRALRRMAGARLVAVADPDPKARERAAKLISTPIYKDAAELLARSDIDAVVITAPNIVHAELATAAAAAGKNFYLEKPIAVTLAEAHAIVNATERAGVLGVIGFNRRCNPFFEHARRLLDAGRVGRIRAVQTIFCEPNEPSQMPDWKRHRSTGGGALFDLASHHVDLLRWFLSDEITDVTARLQSERSDQDSVWLRIGLARGVEASVFCSFRTGAADSLEFFGENGTLRVDRHRCSISLRLARRFGYGVRNAFVFPARDTFPWRLTRLVRPSYDDSYRRALSRFVSMCRGEPQPHSSLNDGVRSLEVILAAEESSAANGAVRRVSTSQS